MLRADSLKLAGVPDSLCVCVLQLENTVGGQQQYQQMMTQHLVPCVGHFSVALADDSQWKTYIELMRQDNGRGARFRIWMPIVEGLEQQPEATQATELAFGSSPLTGREILVAEDEPVVLELLARLLTDAGANVTMAQDGEEAWRLLVDNEFDLVVTDLCMPNLCGQELYERVASERPELMRRFVFATGDLVRKETLSFLDGLPNRILTKPLEVETVRRVLSQAIDAAS